MAMTAFEKQRIVDILADTGAAAEFIAIVDGDAKATISSGLKNALEASLCDHRAAEEVEAILEGGSASLSVHTRNLFRVMCAEPLVATGLIDDLENNIS
jgi:hypothetical protein